MFWDIDCKLKQNDAREGKKYTHFCKKKGQILCKNKPFFAYKTRVLLKKTVKNWRFNLWKCAARACAWKHPKRILSIFMHIYEGLDDFWTVFFWWRFTLFCNHLGPIRSQKRVILGWFWGSIRGHFFCIVYIDVVGNVSLGKKTLCSGFFSVPGFFLSPVISCY